MRVRFQEAHLAGLSSLMCLYSGPVQAETTRLEPAAPARAAASPSRPPTEASPLAASEHVAAPREGGQRSPRAEATMKLVSTNLVSGKAFGLRRCAPPAAAVATTRRRAISWSWRGSASSSTAPSTSPPSRPSPLYPSPVMRGTSSAPCRATGRQRRRPPRK